ncbi:IclR family transcriptional regulator [Sphingomonas sp. AP4-R1]|uniref:IclR family transcriptional regulator n=1 Tax=Sphingomonas sp. AP4-R1 TaxID=2735134 RepID=UPI00149354C6|nr:IclR family transcriptional regulator [Sphingomonas sp. AP4-R1]QJU58144.1 IclR family transcriptional regulator [Sphingomonas sp. AP4-R1]
MATAEIEVLDDEGPLRNVNEGRDSSNSLTKMLGILDLFVPDRPIWSTNDIIQALETSRSTGYRYIKALNSAGLLSAVGNGYYVLGPRIIELDLQIRGSDPLLQAGRGVLEQLVDLTGHSALLCMLYRNSVLCIREQLAPLSPDHLFSRGQRRSLFRGAISKVILAYLPNHRLRSIFKRNEEDVAAANLGKSWSEFREALAQIRKDGHAITYGEFNPGVVGIAAPVYNSENVILGSVGIALAREELSDVDVNRLVIAVKRAAREITTRTTNAIPGMDLLPRAVG